MHGSIDCAVLLPLCEQGYGLAAYCVVASGCDALQALPCWAIWGWGAGVQGGRTGFRSRCTKAEAVQVGDGQHDLSDVQPRQILREDAL